MTPGTDPVAEVNSHTEARVAVLLGATPGEADAVVQVLIQTELLHHGVATVATAAASRWGVEVAQALTVMASGKSLGASFSDYELRAAKEEAETELQDARQVGAHDGGSPQVTMGNSLDHSGVPALVVPASGHHVDSDV